MKPPPVPKRGKPQQSSGNVLLDALNEVEADRRQKLRQQQRAKKLDRWFGWARRLPGGIRFPLLSVAGIFLLLVGDGWRRESRELSARVAETRGGVTIQRSGTATSTIAKKDAALAEKDVIVTGPDGETTLVFPDGSAILVEPNSRFEVRLLGFSRGDVRDRSFMVHFGAAVAHFGSRFGKGSRGAVASPTAVAAVRGTGFRVFYDPAAYRKSTFVAVVEGTVQFRTSIASAPVQAGQVGVAAGAQIQGVQRLAPDAHRRVLSQVQRLQQHEKPPGLLESVEKQINQALNPVLQVLGIAPGGWGFQAMDAARLTSCREALRRLGIHLEGTAGNEVPPALNLTTLEELRLAPKEQENLLNAFAGGMLESYRRTGRNGYVVRARARDRKQTLFELVPGGVSEIRE